MCKEDLNVELSLRIPKFIEDIGCIFMGSIFLRYFPILFIIVFVIFIILHLKEEIRLAIKYLEYKYTGANFDKSKKKKNLESINLDTISDADFLDEL